MGKIDSCNGCYGLMVGGCEGTDDGYVGCEYYTYEDGETMDIKKVSVSKGVTVSVGKFESLRLDVAIEVEPGKGEDFDTIVETGYEMCDEKLNKQLSEVQDLVADNSVFKVENVVKKPKKKSGSRRRS